MQGTDPEEIVGLVDRCLTGERQAQFALYQRYSKAMFNTCLRLMGNHADAEDMLQEAFLDAFATSTASRGRWLLAPGSSG